MTSSLERLVVFARAPELGSVKTRLCPPLSPPQALELHRALVEDTIERMTRASRPQLETIVYWSGPSSLALPPGFSSRIQNGSDLGARIAQAAADASREGCARTVIVGTDSPTLPLHYLDSAFDALSHVDAVLGPAEDGGYYLVGFGAFIPELFENIPWGTSSVLARSRERLAAAGLTFETLAPWYDVDRPDDLERLREEILYLEEHAPDDVPRRVAAALRVTAS